MQPIRRLRTEQSVGSKSSKYFDEIDETDANGIKKFKCKICTAKLSGTRSYNLASHLQHVHQKEYNEINGKKESPIEVKRIEILHSLVEIVTVNGRPFRSLLDSGFQSLIREDVKRINSAGCSLNLSDNNLPEVKKKLHEMANTVREKIKKEVNGRVLSLLCDIVTKNRRSIFGISIQYMFKGKLRVRSIGMMELHESNTGLNLAAAVCARLKLFDIELKQILTVSTDNGSNILKMVRDMDNILQDTTSTENNDAQEQTESIFEQVDDNVTETENHTDELIAKMLSDLEETSDDQTLGLLFDDLFSESHTNLLNDMTEQIIGDSGPNIIFDITGVNCAAHTLQLAIKDALKDLSEMHTNVIKLCRSVAKALRLKSIKQKMARKQYRIPRLEGDTRWGSLYLMVEKTFSV